MGGDEIPRAAWRDHGAAIVVGSPEDAVRAVDGLAPEHLELQTDRDDWYFEQLRNYGSIFIGPRATVAFSDKAIGTNHTLPTGQAARYSGGLSVAKFLKTLTFQRVDTRRRGRRDRPRGGRDLPGRSDAGTRGDGHLAARSLGAWQARLSRAFTPRAEKSDRALAREDEGSRDRGVDRRGNDRPVPGDLAGHRLGI